MTLAVVKIPQTLPVWSFGWRYRQLPAAAVKLMSSFHMQETLIPIFERIQDHDLG